MDRTASVLSPADLASYRKALKKLRSGKKPDFARVQKAQKIARQAALMLKEQFGVEKVILFGSVVHPHLFHAGSDIDLAIWDLTGREYFRAVGLLQSLDAEIKIDLVVFSEASPVLQAVIQRDGKEL